jgi:futalosine hydrolase
VPEILVIAATEPELCGHPGVACGVGPVEAASATARALVLEAPEAVLHVGLAGGRRLEVGAVVVGTVSVYADISAAVPVVSTVEPDPALLAAARAALPGALALPIGTSATVGRLAGSEANGASVEAMVEAMEGFGVLRACVLAGVPAVEVRVVSNEIGEADRARWDLGGALEVLAATLPVLLGNLLRPADL